MKILVVGIGTCLMALAACSSKKQVSKVVVVDSMVATKTQVLEVKEVFNDYLTGVLSVDTSATDSVFFESTGLSLAFKSVSVNGKKALQFKAVSKPVARSTLRSEQVSEVQKTVTQEVVKEAPPATKKTFGQTIKEFLIGCLIAVSLITLLYLIIKSKWKII